MGRIRGALPFLALAVVPIAALPAAAGERVEEAVRVYTNADLQRLALPEADDEAEPYDPRVDQAYVREFLERQYDRLDAERAYELDRRRIRAEERVLTAPPPRNVLFAPYYSYPHYGPFRHRHDRAAHPAGPQRAQEADYRAKGLFDKLVPLHARPGGRITPLHARPAPGSRHVGR